MASAAYQRDGALSGLRPASRSRQQVGGLQPSDLIILAGRPSMGKTALATNIAYNVAKSYRAEQQPDGIEKTTDGGVVGFFSLEMSAEQLATPYPFRAGGSRLSEDPPRRDQRGRVRQVRRGAAQEMSAIPLYIDQTGGITIAQLAARARKLKRQKGLGS